MDSLRANVSKQQVRFGFRDKAKWNEDEVRQAIEKNTIYKVGEVLKEP